MIQRFHLSMLLSILSVFLLVPAAWGAGLWLYELVGAPDNGMATAGRVALASDASTVSTNPAGMTRLERSELMVGFVGLDVNAEFDISSATHSGGNGGDAGGFVPAGSLNYAHKLSPDLSIGISAGSYFGLGLDYDDDWAGRYYCQEASLETFGLNPGIGYRINEQFSIGAGITIVYGKLYQEIAVNNLDGPDGQIKLDESDIDYGFNLGILYEPIRGTRFGLSYRSEIDLDFKDSASARGILPPLDVLTDKKINLGMTVPQSVMLSGYHQLTDKLALTANLGWQEQSEFGKQEFTIKDQESNSLTADRDYDDTWHYAVGAQYRISAPWLFSLGFAYDSSPVDDKTKNSPDLALDSQYRYACGLQYDWNQDLTVGVAYEYIDLGNGEIEQSGTLSGDLTGKYDPYHVHVITLNMAWKF
ncbi:MAG: outer membrane protein transport protein [Thermodesulfobacteriota bacterium]|nr:outer membrane protein transport protein [Thermodesulfobacteriota bacterium]